MIRQIIAPKEPFFTINLPESMIGKTIEVIAFEVEDDKKNSLKPDGTEKAQKLKRIRTITKNSLVDLSNFKFNRDDANNYDK